MLAMYSVYSYCTLQCTQGTRICACESRVLWVYRYLLTRGRTLARPRERLQHCVHLTSVTSKYQKLLIYSYDPTVDSLTSVHEQHDCFCFHSESYLVQVLKMCFMFGHIIQKYCKCTIMYMPKFLFQNLNFNFRLFLIEELLEIEFCSKF